MSHPGMTSLPASGTASPWWAQTLLGIALVAAGLFVLSNAVLATLVTVTLLGVTLVIMGIAEAISAFWVKGWGRFALNLIVGVLYAIGGIALISDPVAGTVLLTLVFAASLVVSGVVRVVLSMRHWAEYGWLLLLSGVIGIVAGLMIWARWPVSGLWVFGLVLGIDLVVYGVWWLVVSLTRSGVERTA